MSSAISITSGGMAAASQRFGNAAEQIAAVGMTLPSPTQVETNLPSATQVDLSSSALQLMESKAGFDVGTAVLKSTLDTEKRVLDILV
jgi:phage protein U